MSEIILIGSERTGIKDHAQVMCLGLFLDKEEQTVENKEGY